MDRRHDLEEFVVSREGHLRDAALCIERNGEGIALVLDDDRRLLATITDGDIRRALLGGANLDEPIATFLAQRIPAPQHAKPTTATTQMTDAEILSLMTDNVVRQVPLVDQAGRVVDLAFLHEVVEELERPLQALVMAGGKGSRLMPLTADIPKPLLTVGDTPVIEHIIKQLQSSGITRVNIALHHLSEKIASYLGDGTDMGVDLNYVEEDQPLGTAGALRLMASRDETMLVVNGDIVTNVNYRAMVAYHHEHNADLTVAVRRYAMPVPYGVLAVEGSTVKDIEEKPVNTFFINAGIYLVQPTVVDDIPTDRPFDMTELIRVLIERHRNVVAFPVHEYWLDIGNHADYVRAQEDHRKDALG